MRDLEGKIALVTGGAKNVGRVIAQKLSARGAHVIINYFHSHDAAKQTKAELEAAGARIDIIRASVAQQQQVEQMFRQIEQQYGFLDILVNNAASGTFLPPDEVGEENFARALDTNLKGSFWCAKQAARLMAKRGGGSIVNVSSVGAGLVPANYMVVGTSKAALEALTRYLAVEYAPSLHVRVNTASASMIEGEVARLFPRYEEMRQSSIDHTPLGRLATAEDLAGVVMFLTSDDSRWVTGQMILADGGLSLNSVALSPPRRIKSIVAPSPVEAAGESAVPLPDGVEDTEDIAVVGMGLVVPGADNPEAYWRILMDGPDLFRNVPADRWDYTSFYSATAGAQDKSYQSRSVFIDKFQPDEELRRGLAGDGGDWELTTLWLRHSMIRALKGVKRSAGDRFSFTVGYTADGSQHLEESAVLAGTLHRLRQALVGMTANVAAKDELFADIQSVLKQRYWRGAADASRYLPHRVGRNAMSGVLPNHTALMMVDTACSSSLYAVDLGIKGLLTGQHDVAVCGGSFALAPRGSILFAKLHGLSEGGVVRPLDRASDGVLFADGAGVVVLKRLKRALTDGDRILGVIKAFGASSDGKGKAIYAPNSAGQGIAVERALSHPSVKLEHIDWVVAHATGTPAGDMAEFLTLRDKMACGHPIYVTSNKSLIGHTGWTAGVASLVEVILGLEKGMIPPQHRFTQAPADFAIQTTNLKIPTEAVPWPRKAGVARAASISGFGFGGTNAHLVVQEYQAGAARPGPKRRHSERLAIVGWSAHLPGLATADEIASWLKGAGKPPALSFGDDYPIPSLEKVRMPRTTVRSIDRCQLMILECAHELKAQLKSFWDRHTERIGVLMGHMGPTRNATLYASRCYLDDLERALTANPKVSTSPLFKEAFGAFRKDVERLVPPSNENSFPGMMPNVIPARVANYFDLKGLNMTVDTGFSSALAAMETAGRYLRSGEIEMALVGGISGNSTPEMASLLGKLDASLAEGAFLFALTVDSVARREGLQVLAYVDAFEPPASPVPENVIECGAGGHGGRNYLGAEAAVAILKALHSESSQTVVLCLDQDGGGDSRILIAKPVEARPVEERSEKQPLTSAMPAQFLDAERWAPGQALEVHRHVAVLEPEPLEQIRAGVDFFSPGALIVTNTPALVESLTSREDVFVFSTEPFAKSRQNRYHLPEITEATVGMLMTRIGAQVQHLRLITDLGASAPVEHSFEAEPKSLVALHDLTFLALKGAFDVLSRGNSAFISLFLNSTPRGSLHPFAGLFGGMIKSAALELPLCQVLGVFTSSTDPAESLRQAENETMARQFLPVVVYVDGVRKALFLKQEIGELPETQEAVLNSSSVVVATAGARGITAELLKAVAQHFRPRLYLIGSNRLDEYPREFLEASDEEFANKRQAFLRERKAADPSRPVGAINKEFDRMAEARVARRNIAEMEEHCGAGKVRYIACDVLDRERLAATIGEILQRENRIDLVINAAGLNRSASIPAKSLKDFRSVRDIKLRGYQNLKYALRDHPPKLWCNFGSFIGLTGQLGEADYASANDLLATSAAYAQTVLGRDEFTIGWTLWGSVGLGANPVTKAFLEKSGLFTSMSTEEGVHHFIREINLPRHDASIVHLGSAEKKAIRDHVPDFFTRPCGQHGAGRFYVGKTLSSGTDEIVFERVFDLERDSYLQHHLVNGFATLPGTFVPEIAAEAARQLLPGSKVIALQDAVFHHFLRVYDGNRPSPKKIHAQVIERNESHTVVQVRILTDVTAPNGRLLTRDKLHFEIKVVLANDYMPAPYWEKWAKSKEVFVPDPYHFPAAPVLLNGPFVTTRDTRLHPLGKRAIYDLKIDRNHPLFSSFLLPSLMLDGLARIAVLNYVHEDYLPLAAPASIRRIEIYEAGNDCELASRYEEIELYSTPRELALDGPNGGNRFVAVRPDGRMIMQMKDVTGVIVGYVHRGTGEFISAGLLEERQSTAALEARR